MRHRAPGGFVERLRTGTYLGHIVEHVTLALQNLGLGIDENTAVVVTRAETFRVIGTGAVYVFDGHRISYSSLSEEQPEGVLSVFGAQLHVLAQGDAFDLLVKQPIRADAPQRADGTSAGSKPRRTSAY